jgi:hypothetical protein
MSEKDESVKEEADQVPKAEEVLAKKEDVTVDTPLPSKKRKQYSPKQIQPQNKKPARTDLCPGCNHIGSKNCGSRNCKSCCRKNGSACEFHDKRRKVVETKSAWCSIL